jgi:hypothetical protein
MLKEADTESASGQSRRFRDVRNMSGLLVFSEMSARC